MRLSDEFKKIEDEIDKNETAIDSAFITFAIITGLLFLYTCYLLKTIFPIIVLSSMVLIYYTVYSFLRWKRK